MNMLGALRLMAIGAAALSSSAAFAGMGNEDYGHRRGGYHGGHSGLIGGCAGTLGGCHGRGYIPGRESVYRPGHGSAYIPGGESIYRPGGRVGYRMEAGARIGDNAQFGESQIGESQVGESQIGLESTGADVAPGADGGYELGTGPGYVHGGCGGGYVAGGCGGNVAYPTYPLPTTSSVIYNRPLLYPGWPARSGYGYYATGSNCFCH